MTHDEMLRALTVERFGTGGVLRKFEAPLPPAITEEQWRRMKEIARRDESPAQQGETGRNGGKLRQRGDTESDLRAASSPHNSATEMSEMP